MKPTQITELLANIRKTFVSFFSILMFVALGVGIFLGIMWTAPALQNASETVFDEGAYHNFQIQFLYGLTESDFKELRSLDGVAEVEGVRQSFQSVSKGDLEYTVKVQTIGDKVDTPLVVEGELPKKANEIALHEKSAKKLELGVGDTVVFEKDAQDQEQDSQAAISADGEQKQDTDGMTYLNGDTYKVTGLINTADYVALDASTYGLSNTPSGQVDALAWVPAEAFDGSAFQDAFPIVNVTCSDLSGMSTYGDAYKTKSSEIGGRLKEMGDRLGTARYDSLHDQAQKKIDEVEKEISDGEKKIAETEQAIEEGEEAIEEGEAELAQGKKTYEAARAEAEEKLNSAYSELMGYEAQKRDAEAKLSDAKAKLAAGQAALDAADAAKAEAEATINEAAAYKADLDGKLQRGEITQKEHDDKLDEYGRNVHDRLQPYGNRLGYQVPTIDHTNFDVSIAASRALIERYEEVTVTYEGEQITVAQARQRIAAGQEEVNKAEAELASKTRELDDGWSQYYAGQKELEDKTNEYYAAKADGEAQIADARQQIADAQAQVDEGKRKIEESKPKLEDAKKQLAAMKKYEWAVFSRNDNAGVATVSMFSGVTTNLSFSMAALFVIVGLLVTYSAVSRIVHEQVTQIGTKKALGLNSRQVTVSYLAYSGLAVLVGAIVGALVAYFVVEAIIGHVLGELFVFGDYPAHFGWILFLIVTVLELALILVCTWIACRGILKKHAVDLLRGDTPTAAGKERFFEKWKIWQKLPLFTQVIINNCLNEKRRMFSTIVGVAGCTALIVTALTLNDNVLKSYDRQYEQVYGFNDIAYAESEPEGAIDKVADVLKKNGAKTAEVIHTLMGFELEDGSEGSVTWILVPSSAEDFSEVYHIRPTDKGQEVDLSQDGAWLAQAFANHLGVKVGDKLVINAGDGVRHEIPVLGFYDFWLTYHEIVMGPDYYAREFGDATPSGVLAAADDGAFESLENELQEVDGFFTFFDDKKAEHENFETFSAVSVAVVAIYMVLAVLMAIVVLLNLDIMCIDEKKRELIVLMICGFSVKDAKRYIYNDTIVLTAIGIIVGVVLGCLMGFITVGAIEPTTATFVKDIDWIAVLVGVVGSALLAVIMEVISLRRIPKFDLTDINRF